jgi:hypothetical protein
MQQIFSARPPCSNTDHNVQNFWKELLLILAFVEGRREDSELRAHVCGVFRVGKFLCTNTSILSKVVQRCKSSINNSLHQLGYTSVKARSAGDTALLSQFAAFLQCSPVSRQWTIRVREDERGLPEVKESEPVGVPALPVPMLRASPKPCEPVTTDLDEWDERGRAFGQSDWVFSDEMDGGPCETS